MDKEKLNEIGEKLSISDSDIKQKKYQRLVSKPLYFLIQILIYEISLILGVVAVHVEDKATYPMSFFFNPMNFYSLLTLSIHTGNGVLTIPGQRKYGLSKNIRIFTFLANLLVSLIGISLIFNTVTPPARGVMYGVYSELKQ